MNFESPVSRIRWVVSMGRIITVALLCAFSAVAPIQKAHASAHDDKRFPGKTWTELGTPAEAGWSGERLADARRYAESLDTAAVVIVASGRIISQWGETTRKLNVHSIRKSFLSALYGRAVADGAIRLDATLADLGVDDNAPSLAELEKRARIVDLLKARSGIYHAALYESPDMRARKPTRGSHPPRSFWSYNNWDFNALGTIFEQQTQTSIFNYFDLHVAKPLQMQDFELSDTEYATGEESIHRAYPFRMSARDMARFGLLYLREGQATGTKTHEFSLADDCDECKNK